MPLSSHRNQLEYENVQTAEAELFDGEVLRLAVEDSYATAMSAQRCRRRHLKTAGLPRINSVGKFGFLQHATINLKRLFQIYVPSAVNSICVKHHHFLRPLFVLPSLPGTPLSRVAHTLPSVNIFSAPFQSPLVPAHRMLSLPLGTCRHHYFRMARAPTPPF